jgi:SAM-dependent methyltransferase
MEHEDAQRWNKRYAADGRQWLQQQPRRLLRDFTDILPPRGLVLDAAGGVSTHGFYLAQRGLKVITMDISIVGLQLARRRARQQGVYLATAVADLATPPLAPTCFDLIVNFRFLERNTFTAYRRALKPGGLLIFETFVSQDPAQSQPVYYLQPGELHAAFADFHVYHYQEKELRGRSGKLKVAAQLVARKK